MFTNIDTYFLATYEFKVAFGNFYDNVKWHLQSDCSIDVAPIQQNLLT